MKVYVAWAIIVGWTGLTFLAAIYGDVGAGFVLGLGMGIIIGVWSVLATTRKRYETKR